MKKLAMVVLDGFGLSNKKNGNAVALANTPFLDECLKKYPHAILKTDGENVGLEKGVFGNSEVGHLNMGTGRVVLQELTNISNQIRNKTFFKNKQLVSALNKTNVHLIGLLSDGKVHADMSHLKALIEMAKIQKVENLYLHLITDGRDTDVHKAKQLFEEVKNFANNINYKINFASVSGRYFAMDREKNWNRTKQYFEMLIADKQSNKTIDSVLKQNLKNGVSDEFICPVVLKEFKKIEAQDGIIFFNFRADRMRQLCELFVNNFANTKMVSFTQYSNKFKQIEVAFKNRQIKNCLSEVLSKQGLKQLRVAETTKYAHVTYFFNGEKERAFKNEKRVIIKGDATEDYAKNPEMKTKEIVETVIKNVKNDHFDFVLVNFANCDMVGHTGNLQATIKAVESVDKNLNIFVGEMCKLGYDVLVTADHGNADYMIDENGNKVTTHSTAPAPFVFISNSKSFKLNKFGKLSNIAPTILDYFKIKFPKDFTEKTLFKS